MVLEVLRDRGDLPDHQGGRTVAQVLPDVVFECVDTAAVLEATVLEATVPAVMVLGDRVEAVTARADPAAAVAAVGTALTVPAETAPVPRVTTPVRTVTSRHPHRRCMFITRIRTTRLLTVLTRLNIASIRIQLTQRLLSFNTGLLSNNDSKSWNQPLLLQSQRRL